MPRPTSDPRVLLMTPFYKPYLGGTEIVVDRLLAGLRQAFGADNVALLTSRFAFPWVEQPDLPHREYEEGVLIDRTAVMRATATADDPEREPELDFAAITRMVEDFDPTIIHWVGGGWHGARLHALDASRGRAQAVWTPCYLPSPHGTPSARTLARRASVITCQTSMERQAVVDAWGVSSEVLTELQPGSDRLPLAPSATEDKVRLVLCVGRIGDHKGQLALVEQWLRVKDRLARPHRLVIIGEHEGLGAGVPEIEALLAARNAQDDVLLTGWQNDRQMAEWYSRATLVASMSRLESFGMAYCEAMRAGVPVMAWNTGPIREVLRTGGVIVDDMSEPDGFGDAMGRLLDDDVKLGSLRRRAVAVGTRRSWDAAVKSALGAYEMASVSDPEGAVV